MQGLIETVTKLGRHLLGTVLKYGNPAYHWHRMREDLRHFSNAIKTRKDFGRDVIDRQALAEAFRGKLFGSFFFSGPFSLSGVLLGTALQYAFSNPWLGVFVPLVVGHSVATVAYQFIWWLDNRKLYATYTNSPFKQWLEMERDLIPVHVAGFKIALAFGAVTIPMNSLILVSLGYISPHLARVVPISVIAWLIEIIFVSSTVVRVMGDMFERHAFVLADKYRMALNAAA